MDPKTLNSLNWIALAFSVSLLGWVGKDIYGRHNLAGQDQQLFSFGEARSSEYFADTDLLPVLDAHLFGEVPKAPPKAKPKQPNLAETPATKLKLVLTGVVTAPVVSDALAIIEIRKGETGVVRVGEEIGKSGARLHAVEADHIIIDRKGTLERLEIKRKTLKLENLANSNSQTIKELNIDVGQFEALAKVDENETGEALMKQYLEQITGKNKKPAEVPESVDERGQAETGETAVEDEVPVQPVVPQS